MKKLKYIIMCIFNMNYKGFFDTISKVHKISGKNRVYLFFDVIICGLKYGAGYKDYLLFEFYNLSPTLRKTYMTRGINNTINRICNNREYYHIFDNKNEFYARFSEFIKREWVYIPETSLENFEKFMADKDEVIVKPSSKSCGEGIDKLKKSNYKSIKEMYDYISNNIQTAIVEEVIKQCDEMKALYPSTVNTLRVTTILNNEGTHIVFAFLKIGNSDKPVDNINAGGMFAPVDLDSGTVKYPAYDKNRNIYSEHPKTGCKIQGFKIPWWHEIVDMCIKASTFVPQIRYVGWDVAITPEGPVLVEGNNMPGYDFLQMPPHTPDKIGMLPKFKSILKELQ
jgi:hypothetical protein